MHDTVDAETPGHNLIGSRPIYIPRRQTAAWSICLARVQVQSILEVRRHVSQSEKVEIILFEVQDDWWIR